jgi:hypothetical protein
LVAPFAGRFNALRDRHGNIDDQVVFLARACRLPGPGALLRSPGKKISGWPGSERFLPHIRRPARSCPTPVALAMAAARGGAWTPAVHKMVLASCRVRFRRGP